jgi:hypothetical protein
MQLLKGDVSAVAVQLMARDVHFHCWIVKRFHTLYTLLAIRGPDKKFNESRNSFLKFPYSDGVSINGNYTRPTEL